MSQVVSFVHNDVEIRNPFECETGRFAVTPAYYGFEIWDTGGGCKAWGKNVEHGQQILITDGSGSSAPANAENPEDVLIGLYARGSGDTISYNSLSEAIAETNAECAPPASDVQTPSTTELSDRDIESLAQEALDAAARVMQDRLGVKTGDLAGMFFSDGEVEQSFKNYIRSEIQHRKDAIEEDAAASMRRSPKP